MAKQKFTYESNNSGGSWWLSDNDWKALEKAGWKVKWFKGDKTWTKKGEDRWLGSLAREASKKFNNINEAIAEFEQITGQNYEDEGCECCGRPHSIY